MDRPSRCVAIAPWTTVRGLLRLTSTPQQPRHTVQPPPSSGCTVHAQGLKSWGGGFIGREFCLGF